jgi:hypothetical protein
MNVISRRNLDAFLTVFLSMWGSFFLIYKYLDKCKQTLGPAIYGENHCILVTRGYYGVSIRGYHGVPLVDSPSLVFDRYRDRFCESKIKQVQCDPKGLISCLRTSENDICLSCTAQRTTLDKDSIIRTTFKCFDTRTIEL